MPLIKSKSPEAFKNNLKTEIHTGKPMKQSLAIAYAMKRKANKMAHGGMIHKKDEHYQQIPESHKVMNRVAEHETEHEEMMEPAGHEATESAGEEAYEHMDPHDLVSRIMNKRKMMAKGGVVADEGMGEADEHPDNHSADYDYLSSGDLDDSTTNSGSADGDYLGNSTEDEDRHDIVARIMRSRMKKDRMPNPA
jgi:hypothetical protein